MGTEKSSKKEKWSKPDILGAVVLCAAMVSIMAVATVQAFKEYLPQEVTALVTVFGSILWVLGILGYMYVSTEVNNNERN
jgi:mannose/fructose/N-acetylgalactosamine-specific phosphotransferase system component IIC